MKAKWQTETDHSSLRMDLGTVFHAIMEEVFLTLTRPDVGERVGRDGWVEIPSEELFTIAREVYARPDMPPLPADQRRELALLLRQAVAQKWPMNRFAWVEKRLMADVLCPDGKVRTLTGKPDVVFTDPPYGWNVIDHKTGWQRPPKPRNPDDPAEWEKDNGRRYLGEGGSTQLDIYGFLILKNKPTARYATLEEHHWRWSETRRATLYREELEHVEAAIGAHLMKLDGVLRGEIEAEPRPGWWCHQQCPRQRDCPIPPIERGEGAITGPEDAAEYAQEYIVSKARADDAAKKLKAAIDGGMEEPVVNDTAVGWVYSVDPKTGKQSRSFKARPAA